MYKTDEQRKKEGLPLYYTAPELDRSCAAYFEDCDKQDPPRQPTLPGLMTWLGIGKREWETMSKGEPGYTKHPPVCEKALLEMRDRLEQRKDAGAIFLLKQTPYGGYSDRPERESGGIQVQVTFGTPKKGNKGR